MCCGLIFSLDENFSNQLYFLLLFLFLSVSDYDNEFEIMKILNKSNWFEKF